MLYLPYELRALSIQDECHRSSTCRAPYNNPTNREDLGVCFTSVHHRHDEPIRTKMDSCFPMNHTHSSAVE